MTTLVPYLGAGHGRGYLRALPSPRSFDAEERLADCGSFSCVMVYTSTWSFWQEAVRAVYGSLRRSHVNMVIEHIAVGDISSSGCTCTLLISLPSFQWRSTHTYSTYCILYSFRLTYRTDVANIAHTAHHVDHISPTSCYVAHIFTPVANLSHRSPVFI